LSLCESYAFGQKDGYQRMWDENSRLRQEEFYVLGYTQGLHRRWDDRGALVSEVSYDDGLLDGTKRLWFGNGQLFLEEKFSKSVRIGTSRVWHENGQISIWEEYDDGRLHGRRQTWYADGCLASEEVYARGVLNGTSRYWDADGRIQRRAAHFQGRLHGEQIEWDEAGKEKSRTFYAAGRRFCKRYENLILTGNLHAKHVLKMRNAFHRRVCTEVLGYSRFLSQLSCKIIQKDGEQELVVIPAEVLGRDWEEIYLVKVKCPSTGAFYTLRVPPVMKTVKQAVAWTFGVKEDEYQPEKET